MKRDKDVIQIYLNHSYKCRKELRIIEYTEHNERIKLRGLNILNKKRIFKDLATTSNEYIDILLNDWDNIYSNKQEAEEAKQKEWFNERSSCAKTEIQFYVEQYFFTLVCYFVYMSEEYEKSGVIADASGSREKCKEWLCYVEKELSKIEQ